MRFRHAHTFSIALVLFTLAATPALAQTAADQDVILKHRLTLDNVKKVFAVDKDLLTLATTNPALAEKAAKQKPTGLDDSAKLLESIPEVAAVLKSHGISGRDYVLTMLAMTGTAFAYQFASAGKMPELPAGVQKDNLEFWKSNITALKPAFDEWQKVRGELMKRLPK